MAPGTTCAGQAAWAHPSGLVGRAAAVRYDVRPRRVGGAGQAGAEGGEGAQRLVGARFPGVGLFGGKAPVVLLVEPPAHDAAYGLTVDRLSVGRKGRPAKVTNRMNWSRENLERVHRPGNPDRQSGAGTVSTAAQSAQGGAGEGAVIVAEEAAEVTGAVREQTDEVVGEATRRTRDLGG